MRANTRPFPSFTQDRKLTLFSAVHFPSSLSLSCSHFRAAEGVTLYVDSVSLHLIKGSTIDYVTELIGSQFAIRDNPQAKGAGCGCGVSWEPVI